LFSFLKESFLKIWTFVKKLKNQIKNKSLFKKSEHFQIWTFFNLNKKCIFFYEQFPNLNISKFEQNLYLNNFRIWTIFILEQFSNLNKFRIWTIFIFEQILNLNSFHIWTVFEFS
jgi:hypothetical protein